MYAYHGEEDGGEDEEDGPEVLDEGERGYEDTDEGKDEVAHCLHRNDLVCLPTGVLVGHGEGPLEKRKENQAKEE